MSESADVHFVCMASGDFYGLADQYIARLHRGLCRHVTRPFQLHCVTDRPRPLPPGVHSIDCSGWSDVLRAGMRPTTRKLGMFNPAYVALDDFIYLDLTLLVKKNLAPLIEFCERSVSPLVILKDFTYGSWNSSVMRIRNRQLADVYEAFAGGQSFSQKTAGDQDFIYGVMHQLGRFGDVALVPASVVASFKVLMREGLSSPECASRRYEAALIVKFHGKPVMHRALSPFFGGLKYRLKYLAHGHLRMPVPIQDMAKQWVR